MRAFPEKERLFFYAITHSPKKASCISSAPSPCKCTQGVVCYNIDAGNQHYRAADAVNTEAVVNFTIRYRTDVKPGMWVRFRDMKWNISTLGEYGFARNYLGLKASIAEGVSG